MLFRSAGPQQKIVTNDYGFEVDNNIGASMLQVSIANGYTNGIQLNPASTGNPVQIAAKSNVDTNVNMNIDGKGFGSVVLGNSSTGDTYLRRYTHLENGSITTGDSSSTGSVITNKSFRINSAPSVTLSSCGAGASVATFAKANGGGFTVGTGAAGSCTINMPSVAFSTNFVCVISPNQQPAALANIPIEIGRAHV